MAPLEIIIGAAVVIITVGVGCELELDVLKSVVSKRRGLYAASLGIACQFILMPLLCWLLAFFCGAEDVVLLGFIITGAVPGGSNSNIFALWAKGNIELSAFMSTVSTLLSFGLIPLWLLIISAVEGIDAQEVNFGALTQTFGIMVVGLLVGIGLARVCPSVKKIAAKVASVAFILLVTTTLGFILYEYFEVFKTVSARTYLSSVLLWPVGAGASYFLAWMLGFAPETCRTILMEVSFPNLGLGFAIILRIIPDDAAFARLLPFPFLARTIMSFYSIVAVFFFRAMHKRNLKNGVVDKEEAFTKPLLDTSTDNDVKGDVEDDVDAIESESKVNGEKEVNMAAEVMV